MPQSHPKDGYVFVITYGRSGSTLLQRILNAIPGYQIRGENNNALLPLMRTWRRLKLAEPLRGIRSSDIRSTPAHPWYGGEHIDPDQVGAALAVLFRDQVLHPDAGTRVCGFKEIRFLQAPEHFETYLNFIFRYFPGTRFIFNTRDHDAVIRSGWWRDIPEPEARSMLQQAEALFADYQRKWPDRGIHLHYDDYTSDPAALDPMYEFLGETPDRAALAAIMQERLTHLAQEE